MGLFKYINEVVFMNSDGDSLPMGHYTMPGTYISVHTKSELRAILLKTSGFVLARGEGRNVNSRHMGAGIYRVKLVRRNRVIEDVNDFIKVLPIIISFPKRKEDTLKAMNIISASDILDVGKDAILVNYVIFKALKNRAILNARPIFIRPISSPAFKNKSWTTCEDFDIKLSFYELEKLGCKILYINLGLYSESKSEVFEFIPKDYIDDFLFNIDDFLSIFNVFSY